MVITKEGHILKFFIQLIIILALVEGLFFSFGLDPELSIVLGVLFVLVALQARMIVRRLNIKKSRSVPDAARAANVIKNLKKASTAPKQNVSSEKLDSGVFAQFESNLKRQSAQSPAPKKQKDEDVIVSLSTKADKSNTATTAVHKPEPAEEAPTTESKIEKKQRLESLRKLNKSIKVDPIGSLFDDIDENLETKPEDPVGSKPKVLPADLPIPSNEFLTGKDLASSPDEEEGIELAIKMAIKEFEEANHEESLAIIRQYTQNPNKKVETTEQTVQLVELKANNEFELGQYDKAAQTYQEIVTQHISKSSPDFLPLLERFIDKFKDVELEKHAIHFMFTALNEYRQMHDHLKMDATYDDIETAYRQTEDWPRLIQTYQNHLSIKKVLKDYEGQLDLLDQLGKLLYDQGDEDKSRKCYKQRLVVEKEMERMDRKA